MSPGEQVTEETRFIATMVTAARLVSKVVALYCLVQGLNIILAGPIRFGAAGYRYALAAPGAPWSWGALIVVAGVVMTVGLISMEPKVTAVGIYIAAGWSAFFGIVFAWAAYVDPTANTTGMWAYGVMAVLFTILARVRWVQPRHGLTKSGRLWLTAAREEINRPREP